MSGVYDQPGFVYDHPGATFDFLPISVAPPGLPTSSQTLLVTIVQLTVAGTTYYFSDLEYGDGLTRWHQARLVGDIAYSRGVECVLWGKRSASAGAGRSVGLGNIELINLDGALDGIAVGPVSEAQARVYRVAQDAPMSAAVQVATSSVTDLEGRGEETLRIVTGDLSVLLDVPLQAVLYETGDADAAVVGRSRPITIGNPLSCPLTLINGVNREYDAHDSDAFTVALVRDSGVVLAVGTDPGDGYRIADPPVHGIELLQLPEGRVVADISATGFSAESIIGPTEGDFDTDLTDWTVTTDVSGGGTASATWDASGAALLEAEKASSPGGVAVTARLEFPEALVAGQRYDWSLNIDATCPAGDGHEVVQVFFEPASLAPAHYITLALVLTTSSDSYSGTFTAPVNGSFVIVGGAASYSGVHGELSALIDAVRLDRVSSGGNVVDVIELLLARAGIGVDQIDTESLAALDAARPWPVSYWTDSATTVGAVLEQVLDSVFGWHYFTPTGQIAFGYLVPPEADDEPVLTITQALLNGGIEVFADLAPGLSTTLAGQRNWYRYGPSEFVDIVEDADRALLSADYRVRCTSTDPVGIDLGRRQGAAVSASSESGIATLLDDAGNIQTGADYLAVLYPADVPRKFYRVPVLIPDATAAALKPGQKVILDRDRFGCAGGRPLRFKKIDARVGDDACVLLFWGSGD